MQLRIGGVDAQILRLLAGAQHHCPLRKPDGVGTKGATGGFRNQIGANQVVHRRIALRLDALQQVAPPGFKMVDPALHLEAVAAHFAHAERARPAVVAVHNGVHGDFDPMIGTLAMRQQAGGNGIVAVSKDVGFHANQVANGAFCGETSAIDGGGDAFKNDAFASVRFGHCHGSTALSLYPFCCWNRRSACSSLLP